MQRQKLKSAGGKEELEGTVTIGCGEIAAVQYLAKIIEKFTRNPPPSVVFDIYTANADQIRQRMDEGLSDIGLYWNRQTSNSTNISACL